MSDIIDKLGITPNWKCDGAYLTADGFKVGEYIADVHPFGMPKRTAEQFLNVRLIESAPEMLEALIYAVIFMEDISSASDMDISHLKHYNNKVSVIEKATGKSWEEIKELL